MAARWVIFGTLIVAVWLTYIDLRKPSESLWIALGQAPDARSVVLVLAGLTGTYVAAFLIGGGIAWMIWKLLSRK